MQQIFQAIDISDCPYAFCESEYLQLRIDTAPFLPIDDNQSTRWQWFYSIGRKYSHKSCELVDGRIPNRKTESDRYVFLDPDPYLRIAADVADPYSDYFLDWYHPQLDREIEIDLPLTIFGRSLSIDYQSAKDPKGNSILPAPGILTIDWDSNIPSSTEMTVGEDEEYVEIQYFGQPKFIQNSYFFVHPNPGWRVYPLLVYKDEWGDAGNQNILALFDDKLNIQEIIWEASCY